jgi:hypothetical protein
MTENRGTVFASSRAGIGRFLTGVREGISATDITLDIGQTTEDIAILDLLPCQFIETFTRYGPFPDDHGAAAADAFAAAQAADRNAGLACGLQHAGAVNDFDLFTTGKKGHRM